MKTLLAIFTVIFFIALETADGHVLFTDPVSQENEVIETHLDGFNPENVLASNDTGQTPDLTDEDDDWDDLDEDEDVEESDPLFYWNVAMYHFNDKLYFWLLKPVARGYKTIIPEFARIGIRDFFHNLAFPIRFVGCVLQGKGQRAQRELARFMFNTTFGVLGFGNPAKRFPKMHPPAEDVGQAFGKWGIGEGFYVIWPFFGPSTLRDSVGFVGDRFLNPVSYVSPTEDFIAITATKVVNNTSLKIGDYEALKEAAINPYTAIRDAYLQNRRQHVED